MQFLRWNPISNLAISVSGILFHSHYLRGEVLHDKFTIQVTAAKETTSRLLMDGLNMLHKAAY